MYDSRRTRCSGGVGHLARARASAGASAAEPPFAETANSSSCSSTAASASGSAASSSAKRSTRRASRAPLALDLDRARPPVELRARRAARAPSRSACARPPRSRRSRRRRSAGRSRASSRRSRGAAARPPRRRARLRAPPRSRRSRAACRSPGRATRKPNRPSGRQRISSASVPPVVAARVGDDDDLELEPLRRVDRQQPDHVGALLLGDRLELGGADRVLLRDEADEALDVGAAQLLVRARQPRRACAGSRSGGGRPTARARRGRSRARRRSARRAARASATSACAASRS